MTGRTFGTLAVLMAVLAGCGKSDKGERKRAPAPPPVRIDPSDLPGVPLTFRGEERPAITGKRLAALEPDYHSTEHRAWKLTAIIGDGLSTGDVIVVGSSRGVSVTYQVPGDEDDKQPVLYMTRRGGLAATLVDPAEPFPEFHGQGGMLGRPGDSTPRVSPVLSVEVVAARPGLPVAEGNDDVSAELVRAAKKSLLALEIAVDGKQVDARKTLGALEPEPVGDDHADTRPTWSLRDIAARLGAGKNARVVALQSADGKRVDIDASAWADAGRKPILRGNRRGELKFHWLSAEGALGSTQLRRVKRVEIAAR